MNEWRIHEVGGTLLSSFIDIRRDGGDVIFMACFGAIDRRAACVYGSSITLLLSVSVEMVRDGLRHAQFLQIP